MKQLGWSIVPFLLLVACAALFVLGTSQSLPRIVASHFGVSGRADGFMPRVFYVWFMLVIVALVPLILALIPLQVFRNPNARINLPNREYWLAPERSAATIEYLSRQALRFATMLLAFLCYAHWLVVRANKATPPHLTSNWFIGGLVVFLVATLAWIVSLIGHFRIGSR
jgi:serine/threonine-protein kinase